METGVDITDMEKSVGQIRAWSDNFRMYSPQMYLHTLWCQSYLNIITELTYRVLNESVMNVIKITYKSLS